MSKMKDTCGDTIYIKGMPGLVEVTFEDPVFGRHTSMELDVSQTRKLIKKLKKALDEMEDM